MRQYKWDLVLRKQRIGSCGGYWSVPALTAYALMKDPREHCM